MKYILRNWIDYDKINGELLFRNPYALDFINENIRSNIYIRINWNYLSENENGIWTLERYIKNINLFFKK